MSQQPCPSNCLLQLTLQKIKLQVPHIQVFECHDTERVPIMLRYGRIHAAFCVISQMMPDQTVDKGYIVGRPNNCQILPAVIIKPFCFSVINIPIQIEFLERNGFHVRPACNILDALLYFVESKTANASAAHGVFRVLDQISFVPGWRDFFNSDGTSSTVVLIKFKVQGSGDNRQFYIGDFFWPEIMHLFMFHVNIKRRTGHKVRDRRHHWKVFLIQLVQTAGV